MYDIIPTAQLYTHLTTIFWRVDDQLTIKSSCYVDDKTSAPYYVSVQVLTYSVMVVDNITLYQNILFDMANPIL